ncbi:MAG: sigma-70 family RNA polymerase sigma factor [Victivallales bacterium]|nr:sigma-70 family RNA polymerase sigma factor [Victivallales bacterium]
MAYTTRASLLRGIHAGDEASWKRFWDFYSPLILFCGGLFGLQADEKQDLRQEVMLAVMKEAPSPKYSRTLGSFRSYLQGIIRHKALDILHRRLESKLSGAEMEQIPDEDCIQKMLDEEYEKIIFNMALEELKEAVDERQYVAYEMYALQDRPPEVVAHILQMSVNQIYLAKSRCLKEMKGIVERLKRDEE